MVARPSSLNVAILTRLGTSFRLFLYYHTLANQHHPIFVNTGGEMGSEGTLEDEAQKTWFWFPLFSFFESGIQGGKVPNEFEWPLTLSDCRDVCSKLTSLLGGYRPVPNQR